VRHIYFFFGGGAVGPPKPRPHPLGARGTLFTLSYTLFRTFRRLWLSVVGAALLDDRSFAPSSTDRATIYYSIRLCWHSHWCAADRVANQPGYCLSIARWRKSFRVDLARHNKYTAVLVDEQSIKQSSDATSVCLAV